ncbi:hypothetical protein [Paractinoplanes abujensis]|uniref:Uncharacterized protein n=1 Tax=Paractinoplanes abujensis TaxID=882441 RepID=A0A7W7G268_9ACTN|nr:hypothetical protein [Actinoplanes abujensis]MBB4691361.1 hypothetical protein [Actinoplanes abujensis]
MPHGNDHAWPARTAPGAAGHRRLRPAAPRLRVCPAPLRRRHGSRLATRRSPRCREAALRLFLREPAR